MYDDSSQFVSWDVINSTLRAAQNASSSSSSSSASASHAVSVPSVPSSVSTFNGAPVGPQRHKRKTRVFKTKEEEEAEWLLTQDKLLQQQLEKLSLNSDPPSAPNAVAASSSSSSSSAVRDVVDVNRVTAGFSTSSSNAPSSHGTLIDCLSVQINRDMEILTGYTQVTPKLNNPMH